MDDVLTVRGRLARFVFDVAKIASSLIASSELSAASAILNDKQVGFRSSTRESTTLVTARCDLETQQSRQALVQSSKPAQSRRTCQWWCRPEFQNSPITQR
eukprot:m.460701 g.460701  ORF g.460701 m.460701 type:complete len:101 (-) comp22107_c0_seq1:145-447(-)